MTDQEPWETDSDAALAEAERRIAEWDGGILFLNDFTALEQLPKSLFDLKGLATLFLNNTVITERDIRDIAQMKKLTTLDLDNTQITDSGVRDIAKMQGLTQLFLGSTQITDGGVKDIAKMQGLTQLFLGSTQITDGGVKDIAQMQGLRTLDLNNTQITDSGVKHIARMQGLTALFLSNTQITDSGIRDIAQMQGLTELTLSNTQITDLRMFLKHQNLFSPSGQFDGIHFFGLSDQAAPELRKIGEIEDNKERMAKLREYLETLPPWPAPLDGGPEITGDAQQSPKGHSAGVNADGRIGFKDDPITGISKIAKDNLDDLLEDLSELKSSCADLGDNTHKDVLVDVDHFIGVLKADPLDARQVFQAAKRIRRLNRIEQSRIKDDFQQAYYDPKAAETLNDVATSYNAFALAVPELHARDTAGIDPAERPKKGAHKLAEQLVENMSGEPQAFDPNIQETLPDLKDVADDDGPSQRDQIVAQHSTFNVLSVHLTRALTTLRRFRKTKEGKSLQGSVILGGAAYVVGGPIAGAIGPAYFAKTYIAQNQDLILEFIDAHPAWETARPLVVACSKNLKDIVKDLKDAAKGVGE